MRVTMDRVGRIVVPKRLRDQLGVGADSEFDIELDGTSIRLDPRRGSERSIVEIDGWPVLLAVQGVPLTDDDVRTLRDADQR
jgi:AbrB family looped-hinge helix DNA binding protein